MNCAHYRDTASDCGPVNLFGEGPLNRPDGAPYLGLNWFYFRGMTNSLKEIKMSLRPTSPYVKGTTAHL